MKITTIEKGQLSIHEQEMTRVHLEDKKLTTAQMKMKMELEMEKMKGDMEMETLRLEQMKEERYYDDGCNCVALDATKIYSSTSKGNP